MLLSELYRLTLPVVATENLVMGASLIYIYIMGKHHKYNYKSAIYFFAIAMLVLAFVNFLELFIPNNNESITKSLVLVIIAASIQLFLFLYAFKALINNPSVSALTIGLEVLLIAVFTFPPLFVSEQANPVLSEALFCISILFYCTKFIINFYTFKRNFNEAQVKMQNSYSEGSAAMLQWINNLFYLVMSVGIISIVIPMTNHLVLTVYNIFIFIAYFVIYNEIIRHIRIFKDIERMFRDIEASSPSTAAKDSSESIFRLPSNLMAEKHGAYETWITNREYAKSGLTIEEVALNLGTNRSTLSIYLNSELNQNFYEWISTLRIEDAKIQLIEKPTLSILDIAINVGIDDRSNFDKIFKRIVGVSPSVYRKTYFSQNN